MILFGSPNIKKMEKKGDFYGLFKALIYNKNKQVRYESASALGRFGGESVYKNLKELEKSGLEVKNVISEAVNKPRLHNTDKIILITTLVLPYLKYSCPWGYVLSDRDWAMRILEKNGGSWAHEHLVDVLCDPEQELYMRALAAFALRKKGWKPKPDHSGAWFHIFFRNWNQLSSMGSAAIGPLIAVIKDPRWGEGYARPGIRPSAGICLNRFYAIKVLGDLGDEAAVEPLKALLDEGNQLLAPEAARSLEKLGDPSGREY